MVNPHEDFAGYMEGLAKAEAENAKYATMLENHRIWRETTFAGRSVGLLVAFGEHFTPFFLAIADALKAEKGVGVRLLAHFVRIITIILGVATIYLISRLIQMVIGKDIVIEQEVVIVEEVRYSDIGNEKEDESVTIDQGIATRRTARDKKEL